MKKLLIIAASSLLLLSACHNQCKCADCPACPSQAEAAADAPKDKADAPKDAADAPKAAVDAPKAEMTKTAINPGAEEIALPKPIPETKSLTDCLQARRSVRNYTDEMISLEQLSALLWSGNGINREDGKRTAPSARNMQSVSIYVTFEKGAYKYDHKAHKLMRISDQDVRPLKAAPVELLMTSNFHNDNPSDTSKELDFALIRGIDSGTVAQNIALYCAAQNIATVIRMQRGDHDAIKSALKLADNEHILFNMALGFEEE